jgi:hypothetical protein|tara:strand:+ start:108 stop:293 length:186 start_codon:yes stop_codon:yes gene_type:complete
MKGVFLTKVAAFIFLIVSIVHFINFLVGGVVSIWGWVIPPYLSLVLSPILGILAYKLIILK